MKRGWVVVLLVACGGGDGGRVDADVVTPVDTPIETETRADVAADTRVEPDVDEDTDEDDDVPDVVVPLCGGVVCEPGLVCVDDVCVCDVTAVSFANDVAPMFQGGCGPGCHVYPDDALAGSGGMNLATAFAYGALVDVPSSECAATTGRKRVAPGDVGGSYLVDKLLGRALCDGIRMPKGRTPWNDEKMALLGRWICQGALDN